MATTPKLGLDTWAEGLTQPQQAQNDNLDKLDLWVNGGVKSRTTAAQPGSPSEGDGYILPASPTGAAWASFSEDNIAEYRGGIWSEYTPAGRQRVFVDDESSAGSPMVVGWDGTAWIDVIQSVDKYPGQREVTGTTDTLALTDTGRMVWTSNAASVTVSIPDNSAVAFPIDTRIDLCQAGDGVLTVDCPGTDTLNGGGQSQGKYRGLSLWKKAATEWVIFGGTSP